MSHRLVYVCLFCSHTWSNYFNAAVIGGSCVCPNCDHDAEPAVEE